MKKLFAIYGALLMLGGAAFSAPNAVKAIKPIDVKVCPITGEAITGQGSGSEVVGKYKVYFCCASCKPSFDKLSKANKLKKVAALEKKSPVK